MTWDLRIDGVPCSPNPMLHVQHHNATHPADVHGSRTIVGVCEGVTAGDHVIQVYAKRRDGDEDCYRGHAITLAPDALIREEVAAGWLVSLPLEVGATAQTCAYRLRSRPLPQAAGRLWRLLAGGSLGMSEETLKPSASSRSSAD